MGKCLPFALIFFSALVNKFNMSVPIVANWLPSKQILEQECSYDYNCKMKMTLSPQGHWEKRPIFTYHSNGPLCWNAFSSVTDTVPEKYKKLSGGYNLQHLPKTKCLFSLLPDATVILHFHVCKYLLPPLHAVVPPVRLYISIGHTCWQEGPLNVTGGQVFNPSESVKHLQQLESSESRYFCFW